MSITDVILIIVRWVHLVSSAAWVGGSLFYIAVLRPALRRSPEPSKWINAATATEFRLLIDTSIFILLITGVVLTFERLTHGYVGIPYVAVLSIKIAMSVWMFIVVIIKRRRNSILGNYTETTTQVNSLGQKFARTISGYNTVMILGILVFLLADLLKFLFEKALLNIAF